MRKKVWLAGLPIELLTDCAGTWFPCWHESGPPSQAAHGAVQIRVSRVSAAERDGRGLLAEQLRNLKTALHFPITRASEAIARSSGVTARLAEVSRRPRTVSIEIQADHVLVTDFESHQLDLFYTADLEVMARLILRRQDLVNPLLPGFGSVLVHGAAIVRQGGCALFLAQDGGGKTTVAAKAPSGTVLSDDRPVIRGLDVGAVVSGSFWGTISHPVLSSALRGIFLLEKSEAFSLRPASREHVLDFLWNEERFHFFLPRQDRLALFRLYNLMCTQSRLWHMEFPRDTLDWSAIDDAMTR